MYIRKVVVVAVVKVVCFDPYKIAHSKAMIVDLFIAVIVIQLTQDFKYISKKGFLLYKSYSEDVTLSSETSILSFEQ